MNESFRNLSHSLPFDRDDMPAIHLDEVVAQSPRVPEMGNGRAARINGLVLGELVAFAESGEPLVAFDHAAAELPISAKTTATLDSAAIGRQVALMFEDGNPQKPIVLGIIQQANELSRPSPGDVHPQSVAVQRDDERLVLTAQREIELSCGEASITLTRAGKVIIRGAYLVSRSSGANVIKGGAVHIN